MYCKSVKTILISVKSLNTRPNVSVTKNKTTLEITEKSSTAKNFDSINSFLLSPSIRFCLRVL